MAKLGLLNVSIPKAICFLFLFVWILFVHSNTCLALTPEEVVVVANKMAWHSSDLAEYYMKKRGIPAENLIELKAPAAEHCSRDDYEAHIASPIRAFLKKNDPEGSRFRCLVTFSARPVSEYSFLLRVVQPGALRGCLHLGTGRGRVPYRQFGMYNAEE